MSRPLDEPGRWPPIDQPRHHHCHGGHCHTRCHHDNDPAGNLIGETVIGLFLAVGALAGWLLRHPPVAIALVTLAGLAWAAGLW